MNSLLTKSLFHYATVTPDSIAVIDKDIPVTYSQLRDRIVAFSHWLNRHNTSEFVGIIIPNDVTWIIATYACSLSQVVAVPIDYNISLNNLEHIVSDCGIRTIVTTPIIHGKIKDAPFAQDVQFILTSTLHEESVREDTALTPLTPRHEHKPFSFLMYTTGTTGPRKGVMLSEHSLMCSVRNIKEFMQINIPLIESIPMMLSHSFGFARLRIVLETGGTALLENGFVRPEKILYNIKKYGANALSSAPSGFDFLLDRYLEPFKEIAAQLKYIELGSAPMSADRKRFLRDLCPNARVCMHYGLTEASRSVFLNFRDDHDHLGSVGKQTPHVDVRIVNHEGVEVEVGEVGQIVIRGEHIALGYWNQPEKTSMLIRDHWLYTGDEGKLDEAGYLYFVGRQDDVINFGGLKISPDEVEMYLKRFPGILDAAVLSKNMQDTDIVNVVISAYIVSDEFIDIMKLKQFCLSQMEPYKVPHHFEIIKSIPRTPTGKIKRNQLKEELGYGNKAESL